MKAGLMAARDHPTRGCCSRRTLRALCAGLAVPGTPVRPGRLTVCFPLVLNAVIDLLVPLYAVGGLLAVLVLPGNTLGRQGGKGGFAESWPCQPRRRGPVLLCKQQDKDTPPADGLGVRPLRHTPGEWEDKRARIETALNITIAKMTWAEGRKNHLCLFCSR